MLPVSHHKTPHSSSQSASRSIHVISRGGVAEGRVEWTRGAGGGYTYVRNDLGHGVMRTSHRRPWDVFVSYISCYFYKTLQHSTYAHVVYNTAKDIEKREGLFRS